jgi:hypothetical protein
MPSSIRIFANRAAPASLPNDECRRPTWSSRGTLRLHPGAISQGARVRAASAWPVRIVLERLYQDLAGLLELWTCLELPNDPASLARLSFDYSLELAEHLLLRHPLTPIAFAKW